MKDKPTYVTISGKKIVYKILSFVYSHNSFDTFAILSDGNKLTTMPIDRLEVLKYDNQNAIPVEGGEIE